MKDLWETNENDKPNLIESIVSRDIELEVLNVEPCDIGYIYRFGHKITFSSKEYNEVLNRGVVTIMYGGSVENNNIVLKTATCPVDDHGLLITLLYDQGIIDQTTLRYLASFEPPFKLSVQIPRISQVQFIYSGGLNLRNSPRSVTMESNLLLKYSSFYKGLIGTEEGMLNKWILKQHNDNIKPIMEPAYRNTYPKLIRKAKFSYDLYHELSK